MPADITVPDAVWLPVAALLWLAVEAVKAWLKARGDERVAKAAVTAAGKVAESAKEQSGRLEKIETTGEKTHRLVNSQHGAALKALAVALRVTADREPSKETVAAAEAAEKASREHDARQARLDAEDKTNAAP
jgi:hypothetical protein